MGLCITLFSNMELLSNLNNESIHTSEFGYMMCTQVSVCNKGFCSVKLGFGTPTTTRLHSNFWLLISSSKRQLTNTVWHEASGTGSVGGLCHCIWEVLQSQLLCCRQHSNEVINNLQQLLRERDLICWARATSGFAVTEQAEQWEMFLWNMQQYFTMSQ